MRTSLGFRAVLWVTGGLLAMPLCARVSAEESSQQIDWSSVNISGFIDTSAQWNLATGNPEIPEPSTVGLAVMAGVGLYLGRRTIPKR